jgi:trans-aconitate methyltransferase
MTQVDYEEIWHDTWGDMQKYGPVHRHHRRIFGEMLAHIPQDAIRTVADFGCGEGSNLRYLQSRFPAARLFGFDISQSAMQQAQKIVEANFQILDIQKEIPAQSFDFTLSSDVIEHLEDDVAALTHIRQATRQYTLIATVQGRMREFEKTIGHVRSYGYGELQQKMEQAGFQVIRVVSWGFPFYSPLYRDLFNRVSVAEGASHGRYGWGKRFLCHGLYALFALNRSDRGDIVFVLARPA